MAVVPVPQGGHWFVGASQADVVWRRWLTGSWHLVGLGVCPLCVPSFDPAADLVSRQEMMLWDAGPAECTSRSSGTALGQSSSGVRATSGSLGEGVVGGWVAQWGSGQAPRAGLLELAWPAWRHSAAVARLHVASELMGELLCGFFRCARKHTIIGCDLGWGP